MKTKKVLALIFALFILTGSVVWAYEPPSSFMGYSALKTADAPAIHTGACWLYGIVVATDGTNAVTFKTYDALTATGTKVHPDWIATTSSTNRMAVLSFDPPLELQTGLSVDITTAGTATFVVYYRAK
jgi:hypothetical protein